MKALKVLPLLFLLGCATTKDISYLEYRILTLENRLQRLEQARKEDSERFKSLEDGLKVPLSSLRADLDALKSKVEQLDEDRKAKGESLQGIMVRLGELDKKLSEIKAAAVPKAEPPPTSQGEGLLNPEDLYNEAFLAFKRGELEKARASFSDFLNRFPDHELADNAQFWIGECYFKQGKYEEAVLEYEKVLSRYPHGNKVPAALYKEGLAFIALGDTVTARYLLEKLTKDFPSSPEASLAKEKLKTLSPRRP